MKKIRLFLFALVIPLALVAQPNVPGPDSQYVIKKDNLDSFNELEVTNGAYVTVQYAEENTISIIGYQHCIDAVSATVSAHRLKISTSESELNCPVEIVLETPVIYDVTLRNGGYVDLTDATTDTLLASVYGGGEIKAVVHDFLYAKIIDGGLINYVGSPDVQSDVLDTGRILKTDPIRFYLFNKATASL